MTDAPLDLNDLEQCPDCRSDDPTYAGDRESGTWKTCANPFHCVDSAVLLLRLVEAMDTRPISGPMSHPTWRHYVQDVCRRSLEEIAELKSALAKGDV